MGNCSNGGAKKNADLANMSRKEERVIVQLSDDIELCKEKLLFNQALLKMGMLSRILKKRANQRSQTSELERLMQLQIEMGRINQDIVRDHIKATMCLETALDISMFVYGSDNEISGRVIKPLLFVSRAILDESAISLKPKIQMEEEKNQRVQFVLGQQQQQEPIKFFQRTSTHATTRASGIQPPSLNIIMEEAGEYEEEGGLKKVHKTSIEELR